MPLDVAAQACLLASFLRGVVLLPVGDEAMRARIFGGIVAFLVVSA